jgi:hypothetical protein
MPIVVYSFIFNSMLTWYAKSFSIGSYARLMAVFAMSAMAYVNIGSVILLFESWHFAWAEKLRSELSPVQATVFGIAILMAHGLYFGHRRARDSHVTRAADSRPSWISGFYMLLSVGIFLWLNMMRPISG